MEAINQLEDLEKQHAEIMLEYLASKNKVDRSIYKMILKNIKKKKHEITREKNP